MRLARYRPIFSDMEMARPFALPDRVQRMFADLMAPLAAEGIGWSPQVDVLESEAELVIRADLPGLTKDEVELEVKDGTLVLRGEKKEEKEETKKEYRVVERSYGAFERSFALPTSVDADKIAAEFRNGVLEVHLPKTEKAVGRRVLITER